MPEIPARGRCTCPGGTVPLYRAYHEPDCPDATAYDKQRWAQDVLADPVRASIEMSGMSDADLRLLKEEFGG